MDHQITLDRNQKEEALKSMMEQGTDLSPKAGVLTRTVVRSPVINWIIPARVRHKDKNDVIFIGETFIHIRELRKDRHLYDVVIKSDFGAKILHARIFGESRTTEDAEDTKTEPSGVDTGIRDDIPDLSSDCVESVLGQPKLPPQFLVLSLDTGKLVFLFAYSTTDGSIEFVTRVRSLQSRMTELQVPGKHIAVDPKSRAMAVSLQQDAFLVYALAPREELRQKVEHDNILDHDGFDPVREERYVKVDGIIMKLDFLYSEESNEDRVVLVLVISKNKQLFIWTFEWDSTQSLRNAREQQDAGYRLPPDDGLPSLLIPLTFLNAFVLVYKNKLRALTYGNVSSTNTQERTVDKSKVQAISQSPFGSNKHDSPLWTSWARPLRSKSYKAEHDDIYLCNQKGSVQVVSHDRGSDLILDLSCPAAEINGSVSTAFASLNLGMDQYDMVIFGGDTSSGASYLITPKQTGPPVRMETVPNWSPSEDFVVSEASLHHARIPKTLNPDKAPLRRDRIFASSGTHPYGALTELRFGLEGRVAAFFAYNPRVTGIWGFSDPDGTVAYVLCSELAHTELIMIPEDLNQDRAGAVSNDDVPGLNLDAETLAATLLGDNIIQVTSGTINACSLFDMGTKMEVVEDFRALGKSASIVRAAFHPSSSCLVTVAQGPDGMEVQASYLSIHQGVIYVKSAGRPIRLESECTCLSVLQFSEVEICAVVGTGSHTLHILKCEPDSGLLPLHELHLSTGFPPLTEVVCESVGFLPPKTASSPRDSSKLVCGLRNGCISFFSILYDSAHDRPFEVVFEKKIEVGEVPVCIIADVTRPNSLFFTCGSEVCQLENSTENPQQPSVVNIWMTDPTEPSYLQKPITALNRIVSHCQGKQSLLNGCLVCVSGDQLIVAVVEETPKTIPRHTAIGGRPRRVLHSIYPDVFIVAFSKHSMRRSPGTLASDIMTAKTPSLAFLDYESGLIKWDKVQDDKWYTEDDRRDIAFSKLEEQIFQLLDWTCSDGKNIWHFVVVGTGTPLVDPKYPTREAGHVILLRVSRKGGGEELEVEQKYVLSFPCPVHAVAGFGQRALLISTGTEVCLRRLNMVEKKFESVLSHTLPSACIYMTISEPYIYVSTRDDSVFVLRYTDSGTFVLDSGDSSRRTGQSNLLVPGSQILLASDKEGTVRGLFHPRHPSSSKNLKVLFVAELPSSVMRLQFGATRPPWESFKRLPGVLYPLDDSYADQTLFGMGIDGSLFQFTILTQAGWQLLRFIQNMALRSPRVCPIKASSKATAHLEPKPSPRGYHIDGDILARLLERGLPELNRLLDEEPLHPTNHMKAVDFDSASARRQRFNVLVAEIFGPCVSSPVSSAHKYMNELLKPVI